MKNKLNNNKGVTQIILLFALTAIIASTALVLDIGFAMTKKIQLSNALDAAALSGALSLPTEPEEAINIATTYVELNGFGDASIQVVIGDDNHSITVSGQIEQAFYLAPIIGVSSSTLSANAKVGIGPVGKVTGVRPFGIDSTNLIFGEQVVLKEEAGDGSNGNFGVVSFDSDFGASNFKHNIIYGYNGLVSIGDVVDTEPGNMATSINVIKELIDNDVSSTYDNYSAGSERVWVIPVLDNLDLSGRSEATIIGFAAFFIEDIETKAGKAEVTGRFIEYTANGVIDNGAVDTGVYAMKLLE